MAVVAGALLLFLFRLAYSPGPGNMFFAAMGARSGVAARLPANAGYHVATLVVTGLVGAGFVAVLDPASSLFLLLETSGSIYVLWLAWKMATSVRPKAGGETWGAGYLDGVVRMFRNETSARRLNLVFASMLACVALWMLLR